MMNRIEDVPPILVKTRDGSIRERSIIEFIDRFSDRSDQVVGSMKSFLPSILRRWKKYDYFESIYLQLVPTEKQLNRIKNIGGNPDEATTFDKARRLIAELEAKLPPTPAVKKALSNYGQDPSRFTRESAIEFLEQKEKEEEDQKKRDWLKQLREIRIDFEGQLTSIDIEDIESFEELRKELCTARLEYPFHEKLSPSVLKEELNVMDSATCFLDDMSDHLQALWEYEELSRRLRKSELRALFPGYVELLRADSDDTESILALVKKLYPELVR